MNEDSSQGSDLLMTILDYAHSAWDWMRSRLFALDERTRLNLLLTIFNLMLLTIVIFALLNRRTEIRYRTVVQIATAAQATATFEQARAYSEGREEGATKAVAELIDQITATGLAQPTATPRIATPTSRPPTATSAPRPPTATPTPLPLVPTYTPTPLPSPTPTSTSPPPADTPTPPPQPETPPPVVLSITPDEGENSAPVPVVITGTDFLGMPAAKLGSNEPITISAATTDTLTGTVRAGLIPGVYDLTVTNPDGQSGELLRAFTAYESYGPDIPPESPYLVTFGRDAEPPYDSGYQVQLIFFEVPNSLSGDLRVRIFDADTGGRGDYRQGTEFTTTISYTLYGSAGAYTAPEARTAQPSDAGITSGTPWLTATIGVSDTLDNKDFFLGPFSPGQGEPVGDQYIFKLAVQGLGGQGLGEDDANWYQVALTTSAGTNTVPSELRMFAFAWTLSVKDTDQPRLYPYVKEGTKKFRLRGFGCDSSDGRLLIRTPSRNLEARCSPGGEFTSDEIDVLHGEDGTTWTVDFSQYSLPPGGSDYLGFWAEGKDGEWEALPIFTRPTTRTPP